MDADALVDARGLLCPGPLLALRAAARQRPSGFRLRLLADDPHAALDVAAWCARAGHRLLAEPGADASSGFLVELA